MIISYKYPIFPDKATQQRLGENLDACRWLYNRLLQDLNDAKRRGSRSERMILKSYPTSEARESDVRKGLLKGSPDGKLYSLG